jgi:hypothetical protein
MICTTLNKIRAYRPCGSGWIKILKHLGKTESDDEPLSLLTILDSNGLDDCLWCCARVAPEHDSEWRLLAVKYARQVQYLMADQRSINVLDVAERFAKGEATAEELKAAQTAAQDAEQEAERDVTQATERHSWEVARVAALAARAATWAANGIARSVAWDAMRASGSTGRAATLAAQEAELRRILTGETK